MISIDSLRKLVPPLIIFILAFQTKFWVSQRVEAGPRGLHRSLNSGGWNSRSIRQRWIWKPSFLIYLQSQWGVTSYAWYLRRSTRIGWRFVSSKMMNYPVKSPMLKERHPPSHLLVINQLLNSISYALTALYYYPVATINYLLFTPLLWFIFYLFWPHWSN